ncbi:MULTISPECIES: 2-amino-4-hydroxy-6-hydroxymethyldihydropteridine diphosphokinase [Microbacterium]|uniref:2-amino-4-hydroxy-6- hydroxymethyldihydropteridine diphosphokinase n=1 Tax=Microbacterium TaxID=33882 RepID=UPI0006F7A799|nr:MULTISPECIES: 2-amino-4-hydroxy-6-hydroxymethyldihydropteridine diphosphokinase [unclassified Microbacterium]MBN9197890.1 2-amino-4-hydroxy-6-hydroxymethyldihydropteridine diphosphokinase [Microbacterium ginsengisoli]MCK9916459.1 2-amino-4-hydroxy-6-hydroxymethyldihydropteridine diphosphokinase [Microbacteriaceae bacterium K1510]KQR91637.1 2-amino-4-hydroxy-6-hydroxymethyldihydropteridine pyrophosphokinase [Microbacterium sp. Leaf347]KQR91732.1 2-amino-4-hydroxy-6-hydroxymethyldihydropteridi
MNRRLAQGVGDEASVTAVVALGSNLGDRGTTIEAAVADLRTLPGTSALEVAPVLETVALTLHGPDASAPPYLNTVALVTTTLRPAELLAALHEIEARHGRVRRERWGDRTLDLDLIAYDDVHSDDPALLLPHPRAAERDFVLRPWLAVDPDAVLPGRGRVDALLAALDDGGPA